jgi:uncharacterized protein YkwD
VLARVLGVLATCSLVVLGVTLASARDAAPMQDTEEQAMLAQINAYRAQRGVPVLTMAPALSKAAKWLSADMAAKSYFDHTDSLGRSFSRRIAAFGYAGLTKGENIAGGTNGSAAAIFAQWKGSAPHRKNMLLPSFKAIGVGRAYRAGSLLGWYWTTTFGGTPPADSSPPAAAARQAPPPAAPPVAAPSPGAGKGGGKDKGKGGGGRGGRD